MDFKTLGAAFAIAVLVIAIVGGGIWWTTYKYKDCRKVGHSKIYCVGKIFSN